MNHVVYCSFLTTPCKQNGIPFGIWANFQLEWFFLCKFKAPYSRFQQENLNSNWSFSSNRNSCWYCQYRPGVVFRIRQKLFSLRLRLRVIIYGIDFCWFPFSRHAQLRQCTQCIMSMMETQLSRNGNQWGDGSRSGFHSGWFTGMFFKF